MKRRKFLQRTGILAAGSSIMMPDILKAKSGRIKIKPNDKIRFGVIGCNGMGWADMMAHLQNPEVDCVAMCDVDLNVLEKRKNSYSAMRENAPRLFGDYRQMLSMPDLDAVIIGTPDHWHCKMMIDALDAGKHVYVEKPIALTMEESYLMMNAAERMDKLIQVGQWQRSGHHYKDAINFVQSGKLGKIRLVKVWAYQGWMKPVPVLPDSDPPPGVDYNMWLGPAPKRAFNPNRFHFNFRWFWDYAGGLMTDWGVHEIDIALYAMQAKTPKSVVASGGKFAYPNDASETPDTLQAVFEYQDFNMLWEHATGIDLGPYGRREGIAFIGNCGTLVVDRNGFELWRERAPVSYSEWGEYKMENLEPFELQGEISYLSIHAQNFLQAMKNNDRSILNTPLQSGAIAAINAQMGNIAYRLGRKIYWNNQNSNFGSDVEANAMMKSHYHNGWHLPTLK